MIYTATDEQWAQCRDWTDNPVVGASDACILELLCRVETLEKKFDVQLMQLCDLQSRFHRLTIRLHYLETELVRDEDEPQQHPVEALEL
jgi:hypothetical protein